MKKIGIVYGHVASNMGDLALNTGIAALLTDVAPGATVHAVFLDPNPKYLQNAIESFSPARNFTHTALRLTQNSSGHSNAEKEAAALHQCLHFLTSGEDFLAQAGLSDCDAILYNSGEHLFSHPEDENIADLLCRMLPFVAAQRAGIPMVMLPSTFGPFAPGVALEIVNQLAESAAAIAARDAQSLKVLENLYPQRGDLALNLDPAFFIPATRKTAPEKLRHLGIAMRQENFGLRLGKTLSAKHSAERREDSFKTTLAYQFSLRIATQFLSDKQNKITLLIQTLADRNLALQLQQDLEAEGFGAQIDVLYPQSVVEHQAALAGVDAVIASRFHACILSFAQGVPAVGIHFEQHGHKMRGLFEMLDIPEYCQTLSKQNLDTAASKTLDLLACPAAAPAVFLPVLDRRMQETREWLQNALALPARLADTAQTGPTVQQIAFDAYTTGIKKVIRQQGAENKQLKKSLKDAEKTLQKQFTAFRLGRAILDAKESWRGLRQLPHAILGIHRDTQKRRHGKKTQIAAGVQALQNTLSEAIKTAPKNPVRDTIPGRAVYFLHSSLPYASGGYAVRAHGIAHALHTSGIDIKPYTRPNFPFDASDLIDENEHLPQVQTIDDIPYQRLHGTVSRGSNNETLYMQDCINKFEAVLRAERPEVVHGRSTYLIALPALIAARRCGIPFVYEISGLWEIVHESRTDAKSKRRDTDTIRLLEKITAENADHVFTLTEAMRQEMISRGVSPEKITLTPNCVAPEKFIPQTRDDARAAALGIPDNVPVIGYIGSFVDYEGLDDLIEACATIAQKGQDFRLLLVGDGTAFNNIREVVSNSGIEDKIILTGRVPHDEVSSYYSLIDICPFPRKAWPVCEMVSPLKPLEAMAMGKAILVSSVAALAEMVTDNVTGCVFKKSDTADLGHKLEVLLQNEALRQTIGNAARDWAVQNRNWGIVSDHIIQKYKSVTAKDILSKAA